MSYCTHTRVPVHVVCCSVCSTSVMYLSTLSLSESLWLRRSRCHLAFLLVINLFLCIYILFITYIFCHCFCLRCIPMFSSSSAWLSFTSPFWLSVRPCVLPSSSSSKIIVGALVLTRRSSSWMFLSRCCVAPSGRLSTQVTAGIRYPPPPHTPPPTSHPRGTSR